MRAVASRVRRSIVVAVPLMALALVSAQTASVAPFDASRRLPARAENTSKAIDASFDASAAYDTVVFMDQFWRLAGNAGFLASQDHIRDRLRSAGFDAIVTGAAPRAADQTGPRVWYEEFPNDLPAWDHSRGTLSIVNADGSVEPILSREQHRVALCINSFPTPPGGLNALLVDVGKGDPASFAGKDVKGAIVLGDAAVGSLWRSAVIQHGAAGVVSTAIAPYVVRPAPGRDPDEILDVLQWGGIPYDEQRKAFGFKASRRAATRLREAAARGPVTARAEVVSTFSSNPNRTLVAEIPGTVRPDERIVMVAHVQEPGANDDASGCATLMSMATALARAIADGRLPRPARTLTFLWVDEIRGSRRWIADHPEEARRVQYMFALDMTGEDTTKTGGTFLIEKQADPSAVWTRPSDPHSEWGGSPVSAESLKGSLLNDLHLAVCLRRARDNGWVVRTNPLEGGSDHTPFADAGVPSLLNWHFTDRYYHSSLDRPDKTSAAEMKNVGVSVGTSAMLLASADARDARDVAVLIEAAAVARLDLEARQSRGIIERASDRTAAAAAEQAVFDAWKKWYAEALDSVRRLPAGGADRNVDAQVDAAIARVRRREP